MAGIIVEGVMQAWHCGEPDDIIDIRRQSVRMCRNGEPYWPTDVWMMYIHTDDGLENRHVFAHWRNVGL